MSWIWLLTATVCINALALDRDRTIGQFSYTFWSEKDGAPSEISALAQTNDGYLWIGSSSGLFRFDGVSFEEYQPQPGVSLPSHSIYSLMPTPDGGLWIAFEPSGLGFYKDGVVTVFNRPGELPDSSVHCLARDHDGRIWAGTGTGLAFLKDKQWISVGREWNFTPEMIRYLFVDREGTLWVATLTRIFYLKHGSTRFEAGGAIGTAVTTLAQAPDGTVWLADDGRYEARPVPMRDEPAASAVPLIAAEGLRELLFDKDGAMWITREDAGMMRVRDPGKLESRRYGAHDEALESFGPKEGFPAGTAYKLLEDREGNIWVGCSHGLIRFRHNEVVPVSLPPGYKRLTMLAGTQGDLWIGTAYDRPVLKIRGESVVAEHGGNVVSSVLRDESGDVWWGSRAGIWRQRNSGLSYFPLTKDAVPETMWDLVPSADNRGFWVKLEDFGLVRFDHGKWNLHDWPAGVPRTGGTARYGPSASFRDASGRFWFGYSSGEIYSVDNGHATEYSAKDGVDLGRIKVIRGPGAHIWAGGELGLEIFLNGRFWKIAPADAEAFGAVSGIIETPDSGLWLNEAKGIVQIPRQEMLLLLTDPSHRVACRRFDYLDGLPGSPQMSYTNSTAVRTTDGLLWFATDNGLARVDATHLVRNEVPPPVLITSIANENGHKAMGSPIKFAARTRSVEIGYAGLSLSIPERVRFRYQLQGVDADWQDAGKRRQAFYHNLEPGSYHFRVIASNNDGVWNNSGAAIDFSIEPAFYQTSWFRFICAAALLALLWGLYRLRLHQIRRQLAAGLEERANERIRIARELHDTLLQCFQGAVFQFQAARKLLLRNAENAMEMIDEAIHVAEEGIIEARAAIHDLRPEPVSQRGLPELLNAAGRELATMHEPNEHPPGFRMLVEGKQQDLSPTLQDEIYRIAREVIRNAFRHSGASLIEVEIRYDHNQLRLRIRDDGKGIDPRILEAGGRSGHWGIPGIRERAKRIGSSLDLFTEAGAGTEVELRVPAAMAYQRNTDGHHSRLFPRAGADQ